MISILSCENTCPHGGLRSPWIPWDMGPGQGHMGPMGQTRARGQGRRCRLQATQPRPWARAWVRPMGPLGSAQGPMCPCP